MKNKKLIIGFIVVISILICVLTGCTSVVSSGTYVNEKNSSEKVILTENTISFINVNFDAFNEELKKDLGVDFRLTSELKKENPYRCKDNMIFVSVLGVIEVNFDYTKKYIVVNNNKFFIEDKID